MNISFLVLRNQIKYKIFTSESPMLQFFNNLIRVKKVVAFWEKLEAKEYQEDLKVVDAMTQELFDENNNGIFIDNEDEWLK